MSRVLLDSDIIIWCLRGREDVIQKVSDFSRDSLPSCSAMSVLEVELGMKKGEETATRVFLSALDVQAVDGPIASQASTFIREYGRQGITLDFVDALIAATCVLKGFRLATLNRRHYPMTEIAFVPL